MNDIMTNGEWLTHRYDAEADAFQLRHLTREQHDKATFITDEYLGVERNPVVVRRSDAIEAVGKNNNLHFIFHSAFCASTMMTRGFNLPGIAMGLKEPVLLNDIVGWRRRGAAPAAVAERLDHAMHMIARPFESDHSVVVKPSNVFNSLASVALAMRPNSKAVLLYAPLPVYLLSVARKGLWCRLWCRELLEGMLSEGAVDLGFQPSDYFRQSDLQSAAVGWLTQHRMFHRLAEHYGTERVKTLSSEQLVANPAGALKAAALHFGFKVQDELVHQHPAFITHSKFGGSFQTKDRLAEQDFARKAYGEEIDKVLVWADAVAEATSTEMTLPSPLAVK